MPPPVADGPAVAEALDGVLVEVLEPGDDVERDREVALAVGAHDDEAAAPRRGSPGLGLGEQVGRSSPLSESRRGRSRRG